jgi:hypothetical protein
MASISGGQFHFSSGHEPVSGSNQGATAGHLSLASIGSGFDTVNTPEHGGGAPTPVGSGSSGVVTQAQDGGNTVVHLPDGSSLTIVGANHVDASFLH